MSTPLHRRPGVTVEQIRAKLQVLMSTLQSPEHVASIVTRDYGEHDPRIAPFPACSCGAPARLERLQCGKWDAGCTACSKRISSPQKHDWQACLQWCAMNMEQLHYQDLPLFGLQALDRPAAKARLTSIYNDLVLRCQIGTLELSLWERTRDHTTPGRDYLEKILAYRDWAKFSLQLIKVRAHGAPEGVG
ncbi:hypothetical protein IPC1135_30005 [Pseudomonas aeruginosa]|uniref:hypothetical protein n=1 Tax=Pseudomonas aeruginosa TaxID=287 RepID=UPI000FC40D33|nr:hypothetical protein [Pseudomonas aeruginosa]RUE86400.1 hypothetical protein IPC1135_30005 [Pseudomonas aeruginosa]